MRTKRKAKAILSFLYLILCIGALAAAAIAQSTKSSQSALKLEPQTRLERLNS